MFTVNDRIYIGVENTSTLGGCLYYIGQDYLGYTQYQDTAITDTVWSITEAE